MVVISLIIKDDGSVTSLESFSAVSSEATDHEKDMAVFTRRWAGVMMDVLSSGTFGPEFDSMVTDLKSYFAKRSEATRLEDLVERFMDKYEEKKGKSDE